MLTAAPVHQHTTTLTGILTFQNLSKSLHDSFRVNRQASHGIQPVVIRVNPCVSKSTQTHTASRAPASLSLLGSPFPRCPSTEHHFSLSHTSSLLAARIPSGYLEPLTRMDSSFGTLPRRIAPAIHRAKRVFPERSLSRQRFPFHCLREVV